MPDQLIAELGYPDGGAPLAGGSQLAGETGPMAGILNSEDEQLVATMRRGLAKLAAALGGEGTEDAARNAIEAALDGAEMVMRGELVRGNAGQLAALMPSFVFLVALPTVDQDRALELSRRTAALVEGVLRN